MERCEDVKERIHREERKDHETRRILKVCGSPLLNSPLSLGRGQRVSTTECQVEMSHSTPYCGRTPYEIDCYPSYFECSDTNAMLIRGENIHVKDGYTVKIYSSKEERKICQSIEILFAKINNGSGNCSLCKTSTTHFCQNCGAWYCSQRCQILDWTRHRASCSISVSFVDTLRDKDSVSRGENQVHFEELAGRLGENACNTNAVKLNENKNKNGRSHAARDIKHSKTSLNERLKIQCSVNHSKLTDESSVRNVSALPVGTSVVSNLRVGMKGACQLQQCLPETKDFGVTIVYPEIRKKFNELYDILLMVFKKTPVNETYEPQVGDTVAAYVQVGIGQYEETWSRARVLAIEKGSYQINFCDLAQVASVKSVYKLPKDLESVPEFGARCTVIGEVNPKFEDFSKGHRFTFVVTSVNELQATCLLYMDTEEIATVVLKEWVPIARERVCLEASLKHAGRGLSEEVKRCLEPELLKESSEQKSEVNEILTDSDLKYIELPLGRTIELLVLHRVDRMLYMCCEFNGDIIQQVHGTMLEVMNNCYESTGDKFYEPKNKELCVAKFEDGVWYRGICLSGIRGAKYKIFFIDFGNTSEVHKNNIRKMSEEFIKIPAIASPCSLKEKFTEKQKRQLDALVEVNKTYEARIVSCDTARNYTIEFPHVTNILKSTEN